MLIVALLSVVTAVLWEWQDKNSHLYLVTTASVNRMPQTRGLM